MRVTVSQKTLLEGKSVKLIAIIAGTLFLTAAVVSPVAAAKKKIPECNPGTFWCWSTGACIPSGAYCAPYTGM